MDNATMQKLAAKTANTFLEEFPGQVPDLSWLAEAAAIDNVSDEQREAYFEAVRTASRQGGKQTISTDTLTTITHNDLRTAAAEALANGTRLLELHRYTDKRGLVETLVVDGDRAGQAAGGDAVWGDWDKATCTLLTEDGNTLNLKGEELDEE